MIEEFYVDIDGNFIGTFMGTRPENGIQVPLPPPRASQKWISGQWVEILAVSDLLAHSSNRRWEVENGGFELGGIHIASDDRSKTMITGARIKADGNPSFTTPWKTPDGTFTRIDAATIIMISDAMLDHVAACFDKEELVAGNISSGAITTLEQIDSAWNS